MLFIYYFLCDGHLVAMVVNTENEDHNNNNTDNMHDGTHDDNQSNGSGDSLSNGQGPVIDTLTDQVAELRAAIKALEDENTKLRRQSAFFIPAPPSATVLPSLISAAPLLGTTTTSNSCNNKTTPKLKKVETIFRREKVGW